MRLRELHIQNFRCLEDIAIPLDDLTVLIGANGAGKSSVLRALDWFFNVGSLDSEDVYCEETDRVVSVAALFDDLDEMDKTALGPFAIDGFAWLRRSWSPEDDLELSHSRTLGLRLSNDSRPPGRSARCKSTSAARQLSSVRKNWAT